MSEAQAHALSAIAAEVAPCTRCRLSQTRNRTVPGAGNPNADLFFIGEGPGFHEDKQGLPFVGASGNYLEKLLALIGLKRDDVFIANVVKCRPPENRDPNPDEIAACKDYLDRQIDVVDPLVIVTLGRFSMARYFPGGKITQIHGKAKYDDPSPIMRAYYPLFHPAAVLRTAALGVQMEADFNRIPDLLAEIRAKRAALTATATPVVVEAPSNVTPDAPPADNAPKEPPAQMKLF
jgi:DNA polymerase